MQQGVICWAPEQHQGREEERAETAPCVWSWQELGHWDTASAQQQNGGALNATTGDQQQAQHFGTGSGTAAQEGAKKRKRAVRREPAFGLAQLEPEFRLIAWHFRMHFHIQRGVFVLSRAIDPWGGMDLLLFSEERTHIRVSEFRAFGSAQAHWASLARHWPKAGGCEQFLFAVRGKCDQLIGSRQQPVQQQEQGEGDETDAH